MSTVSNEKAEVDSSSKVSLSNASNHQRIDDTRRKLKSRHIQLIGIGGTIGTSLFVQIGASLTKGGPGNLFLGFVVWCTFIMAINGCICEMVTWMPISAPSVRFADRFIDPAMGFCAGINLYIFLAVMVPFEMTAFDIVLHFWTDKIPLVAVICFLLVSYSLLNFVSVKYYGETEFWLALGKVLLATGLIIFTFVTMVGGNPLHDVYGFRNWDSSKVDGAPFAEYLKDGSLGTFLGFLACLTQASFTVVGPDMVSLAAGEAEAPRRTLPRTFSSVLYRLVTFFVVGSLCIGIVVAYNDPNLLKSLSDARPGAGSSPYVIAMQRMRIPVLPHIVNAMILASVFSAGNSYTYCASRTMFGLALEGKAPALFARCNRNGVPIYCVALTLAIALLAFLQVTNNSAVVLQWFVNLALEAQGISRDTLPYKSSWQPFRAYYMLVGSIIMAFVAGWAVFMPGKWDVPTFIFTYAIIPVVPLLFVFYKLYRRTKWRKLEDIDFFESERALVDLHEEEYSMTPPSRKLIDKIFQIIVPV
ncbi:general amino acid permease agp2 [Marasmius crinis-equi]|uniref:General amino acid permease agp2 n=1 Tax=Marasmius crinis-equi TaxID=585013 RepID=A0ABR3F7M7_9AGAR